MNNTTQAKKCCLICKYGYAIAPSTVFCHRPEMPPKPDNMMDYLETCNHFQIMDELKPEKL